MSDLIRGVRGKEREIATISSNTPRVFLAAKFKNSLSFSEAFDYTLRRKSVRE
jgi:hypothetical protein